MATKTQILLLAGASMLLTTTSSMSEPTQGIGSVPITKDVESVRTQAEIEAKRNLVRQLLKNNIGADRLKEVSAAKIDSMAVQIQTSMIIDRQAAKNGNLYQVTITADVDSSWFARLMDNEDIKSSSNTAGADKQLIFVMLDEVIGIGQDSSKPTSVQTEYDSRTGSSFSDNSVSAFSDKEKAAASYSDKSAASVRSSSAAGYSNYDGSGAATRGASAASATSSKGAAAYSRSTSSIDKADVQSETHDDVRFRQTVNYQAGVTKNGPAGAAFSGLILQFINYGLETADPTMALNSYYKGINPTYAAIKARPDFVTFTKLLASQKVPFFMGGAIAITDTGKDPSTGMFRCHGQLNVTAFATVNGQAIASGKGDADKFAQSYESCQGQVSDSVAKQVADQVGPQINRFWRKQVRDQQETVAAAIEGGDFTLVIRATSIDMGMQADIFDALGSISGVAKQAMLAQTDNQMSFQVSYQGGTPLQLALFQKLRSNPAYAKMRPTVEGRTITLCVSGCQ